MPDETLTPDELKLLQTWLTELLLPIIATPEGWNLTMTEEKLLNKLGITLQR